jgi:hypothetical protein
MICSECLVRIAELERLERIHSEARAVLRNRARTPLSRSDENRLAIAERDAKLDKLICRLELKRHQRNHFRAKPADFESYPPSSASSAVA